VALQGTGPSTGSIGFYNLVFQRKGDPVSSKIILQGKDGRNPVISMISLQRRGGRNELCNT